MAEALTGKGASEFYKRMVVLSRNENKGFEGPAYTFMTGDGVESALQVGIEGVNIAGTFTINGGGVIAASDASAAGMALLSAADANAQIEALGATALGAALFKAEPSAIRYPKFLANNSLEMRTAGQMRTDVIGTDVFLIAGQSNAEGRGDISLSPDVPLSVGVKWDGSSLVAIDDTNPGAGSAWPQFALTYYALTGRRVCIVPAAYGGSAMVAAATIGDAGNWDTSGTHYSAAVTKMQAALAALTAADMNPRVAGILWHQGETDALAVEATTITASQYKARFAIMAANFRTTFGSEMPIFICRLGTKRSDAASTGMLAIRDAQEEIAEADPRTRIVFRGCVNFRARGLMQPNPDEFHYTQAAYNEMGRKAAEGVQASLARDVFRTEVDQNVMAGVRFDQSTDTTIAVENFHASGQATLEARLSPGQSEAMIVGANRTDAIGYIASGGGLERFYLIARGPTTSMSFFVDESELAMRIDPNKDVLLFGQVYIGGRVRTQSGVAWDLGTHAPGTITPDSVIAVIVGGQVFHLAAKDMGPE